MQRGRLRPSGQLIFIKNNIKVQKLASYKNLQARKKSLLPSHVIV